MSQWKKVEDAVSKPVKPVDDCKPEPNAESLEKLPDVGEIPAARQQHTRRHTKGGTRIGRHRMAAPFGLFILILAVVGFISLIFTGIRALEKAIDDSELKEELYEFLTPVMQFNPEPFTDVNKTKQDALLLAAIWQVTEKERIRQLVEGSDISAYPIDDTGRMLIPINEIEKSYNHLFGPDAIPYHHTIGDEGKSFTVEYNEQDGVYHIPNTSTSIYYNVIDTLKKKNDKITVRVGYVISTKIGRDEKGELVEPTPDMADKFQLFTVQRMGETGWKLISIIDETKSGKSFRTIDVEELSDTTETVLDDESEHTQPTEQQSSTGSETKTD